jgi:acetyl-CoA carboxylase biotin carboxylase subunit/propionyl-CoA carboxylase alpha chain
MGRKIERLLIANRGVPAIRVIHTCRERGISTVAVYSTPDRLASHVTMADMAVHVGEAPPLESYLNMERIVEAALASGADAVHPGWGFLAENWKFAQLVEEAGLIWVGPPPEVIKAMGDKVQSRRTAERAGVPTIPAITEVADVKQLTNRIREDGLRYPIMIKAAAGGGGKGLIKVEDDRELEAALSRARSEALKAFGDDRVLVERYIEPAKHIEVQIIADKYGNVLHLFERECTLQRRNQKVIEEAPSPSLTEELRREICATAVKLMRAIGYVSAGTVEFIFDPRSQEFYLLEVNTRLQVEHGVTELITGLDLVALMLDIARGERLPFSQEEIERRGWAIEARLNAEDPKSFSPSFGVITRLRIPQGPRVRVSPGVSEGDEVPPYYDSLIMLVMTVGPRREDAIRTMERALTELEVEGVKTLAPLLLSLIRHESFSSATFSTQFIESHIEELASEFAPQDEEVRKIARFIAEVSALGPRDWM